MRGAACLRAVTTRALACSRKSSQEECYSSVQRFLYDGCYSGYISPQSGVLSYSMCAAMFQGVVGVLDVKGLT